MPNVEQLKRSFSEMYTEAYRGNFAPTYANCAKDFACTNPMNPIIGVDEIVESIKKQIDALEDVSIDISFSFAGEEGFGIVYEISGRHVKELFGFPPSGEMVRVPGVSIHELVDGKSIGGWSCAWFSEQLTSAYKKAEAAGTLSRHITSSSPRMGRS